MPEWPVIKGDPDPQPGMIDQFVPAISSAQEEFGRIVNWVQNPDNAKIMAEMDDVDGVATCLAAGMSAEKAVKFYELLFQGDRPPLDLGAVRYMLEIGQMVENLGASLPEAIQEHVRQAISFWKVAVTQFPLPRRYAPAVAWAVS